MFIKRFGTYYAYIWRMVLSSFISPLVLASQLGTLEAPSRPTPVAFTPPLHLRPRGVGVWEGSATAPWDNC
ncbi:hypothetical protein F5144DRAFT_43229 [Chaetomium tenue]|uniref:Uncharacterized protein n=1 Tax=Chaetomium tenue TaxID=1854479 RepID=A0ACB7PS81_9PEZI|nr:hypothetical protein F5144DRAFT_43229 [Chaetomium globosum]